MENVISKRKLIEIRNFIAFPEFRPHAAATSTGVHRWPLHQWMRNGNQTNYQN
jgi:hypothetical protein